MSYFIQFHYYNGYIGHVNYSLIDGDCRLTYGYNRLDEYSVYARITREDSYYTDQAARRIDSSLVELSISQYQQLLQRSQDALNGESNTYNPLQNPYSMIARECADGVFMIVGGIVPRYADNFSEEARAQMAGLARAALAPYFSDPDPFRQASISDDPNPFQNPGDYNRMRDPDAFAKLGGVRPPIPYSPLVLDLDGGGIATTAVSRFGAYFDLDANGFAEAVGRVGAGEGILAQT